MWSSTPNVDYERISEWRAGGVPLDAKSSRYRHTPKYSDGCLRSLPRKSSTFSSHAADLQRKPMPGCNNFTETNFTYKVNLNDRNSQNSTSFEATWEWAAEGANRTAVSLSISRYRKGLVKKAVR